jgi:hypothetical protein
MDWEIEDFLYDPFEELEEIIFNKKESIWVSLWIYEGLEEMYTYNTGNGWKDPFYTIKIRYPLEVLDFA